MNDATPTTTQPRRFRPTPISILLAITCLVLLGAGGFEVLTWWRTRAACIDAGQARQTEKDWTPEARTTGVDTTLAALNAAAEQLSGDPQQIAQAAARVTARLRFASQDYTRAYDAFMQAGGLRPASLRRSEDVAQRIAAVRALQQANQALTRVVQDLPDAFHAELTAAQLSPEQAESAAAGFREASRLELLLGIRRTDGELCAALLELLELLHADADKWAYDASADRFAFKGQGTLAAYRQVVKRLGRIAEEQARLRTIYLAP